MTSKNNFSISLIFKLITERKKLFFSVVIGFTTAMILISFLLPHKYESYSSLMPPSNKEGGGLSSFFQSFAGGAGSMMLGGLGKSNKSGVYADILHSRSVADYVNKSLNLKSLPQYKEFDNDLFLLDYIRKNIDVVVEKQSGIITVYSVAETPYFPSSEDKASAAKMSADIVNAAIEGLDKVLRDKSISSAKQTRIYIQNEIDNYKKELEHIELAMEKFQSDNNVLSIEEQTTAIVQQAIEIGKELAEAKVELAMYSNELNSQSPQMKSQREKVSTLEAQYDNIQSGGLTTSDAFAFPLKKVPSLLKDYARLIRDRKVLEQVILYLETQKHQEAIQEKKDIPVVEVLDKAEIPYKRIAPSRKIIAILSLLLSAIFAAGFIIYKSYKQGLILIEKED